MQTWEAMEKVCRNLLLQRFFGVMEYWSDGKGNSYAHIFFAILHYSTTPTPQEFAFDQEVLNPEPCCEL